MDDHVAVCRQQVRELDIDNRRPKPGRGEPRRLAAGGPLSGRGRLMCGDPAKTILRLIDADASAHSDRLRPIDSTLLKRAERLVEGVVISGNMAGRGEEADPPTQ